MRALGIMAYNLVLALWVGGMTLFTFLVTPVLFRGYGRDTAGEIVGRLMPHYFRYNLVLILAAVAVLAAFWWAWAPVARRLSLLLLLIAVGVQGYVSFRLYPRIVAVKAQVASFEADPQAPARRQFRTMHGLSMALNLFGLADGVALLALRSLLSK